MKKLTLVVAAAGLCIAPAAAAPPTVTLKTAPAVVAYGGSTTLSGVLSTGRTGESVSIQAQQCGQGPFKTVATATTTTAGAFTATAKPTMNTAYQAKQKSATSPSAAVTVAPLVTVKKVSRGKFRVAVTAAQSFVGKYVVFQRLRNRRWVSLKKVTLATVATTTAPTQVSTTTFRIKLTPKLRVRAILPLSQAGGCYAAAVSKASRS